MTIHYDLTVDLDGISADETIIITKVCAVCDRPSTIKLDHGRYDRWRSGAYVQNVWPDVDSDIREVLISGTHPRCFASLWSGSM